MAKMTKAHHKTHEALKAARDRMVDAIYAAAAPRNDVRFNDCYAMASPSVRELYWIAARDQAAFEQRMINEGRAWRASFGMFTPNYR